MNLCFPLKSPLDSKINYFFTRQYSTPATVFK
jgi:hypothetical protein